MNTQKQPYPYRDVFTINNNHRVTNLPGDLEVSLERFDDEYKKADPEEFFSNKIYNSIHESENGLPPYALFKSEGDSDAYVAVTQTPFGTGVTPRDSLDKVLSFINTPVDERKNLKPEQRINSNALNTVIKSALLYHFNRETEIMAPDGKPLPLLVTAGPGVEYKSDLLKEENLQVSQGDFTPYAKRALLVVDHIGFIGVLPYGYSRGAAVTADMIGLATRSCNEVIGSVVVETPNYREKSFPTFVKEYGSDFEANTKPEDVSGTWIDDGPTPRLDIHPGSTEQWQDNLYKNGNLHANIRSARGLTKGAYILPNIVSAVNRGIPVAVGYGEVSAITGSDFEKTLQKNEDIKRIATSGLLKILAARGMAPHSFGENYVAYAAMLNRGFKEVLS